MSSRPTEVDAGAVQQGDKKATKPSSSCRPSTPGLGPNPTVMETPMTDRQQLMSNAANDDTAEILSSRDTRLTPTKFHVSDSDSNNHVSDNSYRQSPDAGISHGREIKEAGDNFKSAVVPPLVHQLAAVDGDLSLHGTESSRRVSPGPNASQNDNDQGKRKRKDSHDHDSKDLDTKNHATTALRSALSAIEMNTEDPPRKRQKRVIGSRAVANGSEESQNSVRSTIHVETPNMAEEHVELHAKEKRHCCLGCHRVFIRADVLNQHLKRAPRCRARLSSLESDPSKQDRSLSPVAELESTAVEGSNQGPVSPTSSSPEAENEVGGLPAEPPSSIRSTRSAVQTGPTEGNPENQSLRVYYTSSTTIESSTVYSKFLRQHKIKPVKNVSDCDVLCTGKGELKRTSNLILAILMGKDVVTDQWVVQSAQKHEVLGTADFIPENAAREREWGTTLSAAIDRGRRGLKPLDGWTINFTPSIKKELGKSWSELKEVCLSAGATAVQAMIPRHPPSESEPTVVIAASSEPDLSTLEEQGWRVFVKDIITYSVLRGEVDISSDEFLMRSKKKGGGRKKK
ncbi:MAG: hypothetical protein Q9219_003756 [cf. Caloplaca sp. 3 TL-2023]